MEHFLLFNRCFVQQGKLWGKFQVLFLRVHSVYGDGDVYLVRIILKYSPCNLCLFIVVIVLKGVRT